uniref:Uncharacterized protein n=1 Tax=Timema cristinae TaxID=61476 RepID=A0A7R9GR98_TIMCR|nr:unnamed protein product [Timema cristinae]
MSEDDQYSLPNDYPIVELECQVAFDALSNKQKLYAHYLSLASWHGSLAVYLQVRNYISLTTSPESPLIFSLLTKVFSNEPIDELKKALLIKGFSEDNFTAFLVYSSVFFSNSGNYKGFGDTKFVPNLPVDQLEALLKTSKAWNSEPEALQSLWDRVKGPLYSLSEREKQLSYPDKEHAANDFEKKMLDHYQTSFTTGSLDAHKDGSRQWIKNKDPIIET